MQLDKSFGFGVRKKISVGAEQKQILRALWSLVVVIIFWCNKFVFLEFFFSR